MTNGFDVSGTAGTVVGIAGMGIGLGILAHTARGVTETMYPGSYDRRRKSSSRSRKARRSRRGIKTIPVRPLYNWKL